MNMHTTTETTPLAPCPFCGAPAHGYAIEPHSHSPSVLRLVPELPDHPGSYVIEGQCACGSGLIGADETEVVARWNRRAPQSSPSAQGDALERERICAAIKAEDDYCVEHGDYMLDSDDCIKIVRGEWTRPEFAADAARAAQEGKSHDN